MYDAFLCLHRIETDFNIYIFDKNNYPPPNLKFNINLHQPPPFVTTWVRHLLALFFERLTSSS